MKAIDFKKVKRIRIVDENNNTIDEFYWDVLMVDEFNCEPTLLIQKRSNHCDDCNGVGFIVKENHLVEICGTCDGVITK